MTPRTAGSLCLVVSILAANFSREATERLGVNAEVADGQCLELETGCIEVG